MKTHIRTLCALILSAAVLTSCLNTDNDDVVTYSETAIVQFTLGTLNRYTQSTSATTGNDTIIKTTVTGSAYPMTIDHLARRIYNLKPLPVGTDVSHVVCTVSAMNGGAVALQSATSDSLSWFSATDSIDFSQPRRFCVFSADGTSERYYTVELSVSATTGVDFGWQLLATDEGLAAGAGKLLVAVGDSVELRDRGDIVAADSRGSYRLADGDDGQGRLQHSADGQSWADEALDDDAALLPRAEGADGVSWPYATAAATDYVLLVGPARQAEGAAMRVWRKIAPHDGGGTWVYMPVDDANHYPLPAQQWVSLARYDESVLAVGSDLVMYQSRDEGITWRAATTYALPGALSGSRVLMAADDAGRLWLLTDSGQLWQGALR